MSSDEADRTPAAGRPGPPAGRSDTATPTGPARNSGLAGPLLVYTVLRVGLIAVITMLLMLFMPFIVALLFAIIVQLPLSWLLFAGPRRRVNEAMAVSSAHRRAERERLRAALAGENPAVDGERAPG
ncbi:MAG TPA: DUF4229 domain-containing protein [Nakamurella sp.]